MPIPKRTFYFLRHGQTDWNGQGRLTGHADIPLNEHGIAQAKSACSILDRCGIDMVVCSPLVRALKTAAIVVEHLKKPLFVDSDLREIDFGSFEGLIANDLKRQLGMDISERISHRLPADAEQWPDTQARTVRVLTRWLDETPSQTILFVAHYGIMDALHDLIFHQRIRAEHAPYCWRSGGNGWECQLVRAEAERCRDGA